MALTAQQEAFAQYYAVHRNGSDAYRHAYNVKPETTDKTIATEGSALLNTPEISRRVLELIMEATAQLPATRDLAGAAAAWWEIATASPDELIGLRVGACRHCWGDDHGFQWKQHEYLKAMDDWERLTRSDPTAPVPDIGGGFGYRKTAPPNADCPVCEGEGLERVVARDTSKLSPGAKRLYGGVKQTRNGVEVIIADRMKALENATRMLGGFTDKVRLDGSLTAMVNAVSLEGKDPAEAAKAYLEMVAHIAVK